MLIALHGKANSGKDTAYQMIADEIPAARVVRDAFADRLKLSAYRCFKPDATLEEAYAWAERLKTEESFLLAEARSEGGSTLGVKVTGREFLQHYGTEAHRDVFGEDFWADAVIPDPLASDYGRDDRLAMDEILVITDVRFPNEAERVLRCGGAVVHLVRPEAEVGDAHASEQVLPEDLITHTVINDGTLDDLRVRLAAVVDYEIELQVGS